MGARIGLCAYTVTATDSEGDTLKNGIDWDNNGVVDTWYASFTASGVAQNIAHTFATPGTYTLKAQSQDSRGAFSSFSSPLTVSIASACVPVYSCSGNNVLNSCTGTTTACSAGQTCSGGVCAYLAPAISDFSSTNSGNLHAKPSLVLQGNTTRLYWNVINVDPASCSVTGTNGDSITGLASSGSGGRVSAAINSITTYTLQCTGYDSSTFIQRTKVYPAPRWREVFLPRFPRVVVSFERVHV
jgi:hypothetical protein